MNKSDVIEIKGKMRVPEAFLIGSGIRGEQLVENTESSVGIESRSEASGTAPAPLDEIKVFNSTEDELRLGMLG